MADLYPTTLPDDSDEEELRMESELEVLTDDDEEEEEEYDDIEADAYGDYMGGIPDDDEEDELEGEGGGNYNNHREYNSSSSFQHEEQYYNQQVEKEEEEEEEGVDCNESESTHPHEKQQTALSNTSFPSSSFDTNNNNNNNDNKTHKLMTETSQKLLDIEQRLAARQEKLQQTNYNNNNNNPPPPYPNNNKSSSNSSYVSNKSSSSHHHHSSHSRFAYNEGSISSSRNGSSSKQNKEDGSSSSKKSGVEKLSSYTSKLKKLIKEVRLTLSLLDSSSSSDDDDDEEEEEAEFPLNNNKLSTSIQSLSSSTSTNNHSNIHTIKTKSTYKKQIIQSFSILLSKLLQISDELELCRSFPSFKLLSKANPMVGPLVYVSLQKLVFEHLKYFLEIDNEKEEKEKFDYYPHSSYHKEEEEGEKETLLRNKLHQIRYIVQALYYIAERVQLTQEWDGRCAEVSYLSLLELLLGHVVSLSFFFKEDDEEEEEEEEAWTMGKHLKSLYKKYDIQVEVTTDDEKGRVDLQTFGSRVCEIVMETEVWFENEEMIKIACGVIVPSSSSTFLLRKKEVVEEDVELEEEEEEKQKKREEITTTITDLSSSSLCSIQDDDVVHNRKNELLLDQKQKQQELKDSSSSSSENSENKEKKWAKVPKEVEKLTSQIKGKPLPRACLVSKVVEKLLQSDFTQKEEEEDKDAAQEKKDDDDDSSSSSSSEDEEERGLVCITSIPEDPTSTSSSSSSYGMSGIGKTILATLVLQNPSVRKHYNHGMAWINLGQLEFLDDDDNDEEEEEAVEEITEEEEWMRMERGVVTFRNYVPLLQNILSQLSYSSSSSFSEEVDKQPKFKQWINPPPDESKLETERKKIQFMMEAKDIMTVYLTSYRRSFLCKNKEENKKEEEEEGKVLIVLDDVCHYEDLHWFQFHEKNEEEEEEGSNPSLDLPKKVEKKDTYVNTLITTKLRSYFNTASTSSSSSSSSSSKTTNTIITPLLTERESLSLLMTEASQPANHVASTSYEAKDIVRKCAHHPLAVRSVGRWMGLKYATAGVVNSVEEIHQDVARCMQSIVAVGEDVNDTNNKEKNGEKRREKKKNRQEEEEQQTEEKAPNLMYSLMNQSLSPAVNGKPTNIIKLCFAAFVAVFCKTPSSSSSSSSSNKRVLSSILIPTETAYELFEKVLEYEEKHLHEIGNNDTDDDDDDDGEGEESLFQSPQRRDAIMLIPEALAALGVFHIVDQKVLQNGEDEGEEEEKVESFIQIHHDIQMEYGDYLSSTTSSSSSKHTHQPQSGLSKLIKKDSTKKWNKAYIASYHLSKQQYYWDDVSPDAARIYALSYMPTHMLRAKRIEECSTLLRDESFIRGRILYTDMGFARGVERHIDDVEALYEGILSTKGHFDDPNEVMVDSYEKLAIVIHEAAGAGAGGTTTGTAENYNDDGGGGGGFGRRAADGLSGSNHSGILSSPSSVQIAHQSKQCSSLLAGNILHQIAYSLAKKRNWTSALIHYQSSQDILSEELGEETDIVASILYTMGCIYFEMNEHEKSVSTLQECLRVRNVLLSTVMMNNNSNNNNNEQAPSSPQQQQQQQQTMQRQYKLYVARTLVKLGAVMGAMSDYDPATKHYGDALQIMKEEPNRNRLDIGMLLHGKGLIHYWRNNDKEELTQAMKCFEESLRFKKIELGFNHMDLVPTYHRMGNVMVDKGDISHAVPLYEEALRIMRQVDTLTDERKADMATIQGEMRDLDGKHDEAITCYQKAIKILKLKMGHRKEKIAYLFNSMAKSYEKKSDYKKACKMYEECLQTRKIMMGAVHLDVARTLYDMSLAHHKRGKPDKALKCLEESLRIRKQRLGDSEKVAETLEQIGNISKFTAQYKKAELIYEEALGMRKKLHGESNVYVANVMQEMGDLMDDICEYDEAMNLFAECLHIRKRRQGEEHEDVASTLYAMGFTLHNQGEHERSMFCFDEALKIRIDKFGEDHSLVGDTYNMMGFVEAKRGELDESLRLLWEALRIRKQTGETIKASETLKNIGNVHREQKQLELALECYEDCLRMRRFELGTEHEKIADALIALGNVKCDMALHDSAMSTYKEALEIRKNAYGLYDDRVASVLQNIGIMEFRAGNLDQAKYHLDEFVRIRRRNQTDKTADYVNVLFVIGNIHRIKGDDGQAKVAWTEAQDIFNTVGLAEENPEIAQVLHNLLQSPDPTAKRKTVLGRFSVGLSDERVRNKGGKQKKPLKVL